MSLTESYMAAGPATIGLLEDGVAEWNRFVEGAEQSTFCHLAQWRDLFGETFGHEPRYLVARDVDGRWLGVLPLIRVRSRIFGHHLVSMPFLNYGGPIGTAESRSLLAEHALHEARRMDVDLLELRSRFPVETELARAERKITLVLPLPASVEEFWNTTLRSKLRNQVRRPVKVGMSARFGPDQVLPFYEVFARNMRDLGTPVLPRLFFERIARSFGDAVQFGVVYHRDVPVAAGAGFHWNGEFELTWASSLREFAADAPNMLLYFAAVSEAIGRGARSFNFGRCTPGSGTHRFKRQWGANDEPLPWRVWSSRGVAATPTPDHPTFRLAVRAWQRLPLGVANRLGPLLARSIP